MLDDHHQYQHKEQNLIIVSAENHAVDKFQDEAARSAKEIAFVTEKDSVGDSSTHCSDVDDDEEEETSVEEGSCIRNLPISSTIVQQYQAVATANGDIVLPNADPSNFGDVRVKDSTNVHLGNKIFYKGQITIKQYIYTNPTSIQDVGVFDAGPVCNDNVPDPSSSKNDGAASGPIFPQNTELNNVTQWLWTWRCAALSSVLAVILLAAVILTIISFTHQPDASTFPEIPDSSFENMTVTSGRFVKRNEWNAQPPTSPLTKMKLPVSYVIISHTMTNFCTTQSVCTVNVKAIQTFHIESKNWSDISYNFLVGGDGLVYVGRGWDYIGVHSYSFNNRIIDISFIGTFNLIMPPKTQLYATNEIIELGVKFGKIAPDYKLLYIIYVHHKVLGTEILENALCDEIKKWFGYHFWTYPYGNNILRMKL